MPTTLTKQQIMEASDLPYETVEVPEWGGAVAIRPMTANERDAFEAYVSRWSKGEPGHAVLRARLCAVSIVDPATGGRLFKDDEIRLLGDKSGAALDRVFEACSRLNRISAADREELVGNSPGGRPADSYSDSPLPSESGTSTDSAT